MKVVELGPKLKKNCELHISGCLAKRGLGGDDRLTDLCDGQTNEFSRRADVRVSPRDNSEHQRTDQEPLDLYPSASQPLNERNIHEIARHISRDRDDQISNGDPLQLIVLVLALSKANLLQYDRLIEIRAVECHIKQKPARHGAEQGPEMSPLAHVGEEDIEIRMLGLCFEFRPSGIDLSLQFPTIRDDQFHAILPALPA